MCHTASWHGHRLPRSAAGGEQGKEGKPTPAEAELKKPSVGPLLGLGSGMCLSCLVTCLL